MNRPATASRETVEIVLPLARLRRASRRRLTRSAAVAVAVAGFAGLAGCSELSPAQTLVPYQPADGVALTSGPVEARDLLIVASAKGQPGVLSGSLINTTTEPVVVTFAAEAEAVAGTGGTGNRVVLAPREQKQVGGAVTIPAVAVAPGALTGIVMTTDGSNALANVPVLLPEGIYATFTPTPTVTLPVVPSTTLPTAGSPTTPSGTTTTTAAG